MMNRALGTTIYCFLLLFFSATSTYAVSRIDSLRDVLASHTVQDTARIRLLLALANQYEVLNADSVYKYARTAEKTSKELNSKYWQAEALEMLGAASHMAGSYDSALYYYTASIRIARNEQSYKTISSKYNHLGNLYFQNNKFADANLYYDSAINYARKYDVVGLEGKASSNLANVYYKMGNYTRALQLYLRGLSLQERIGDRANISSDLSNIANVYYRLGNYDKALAYLNRVMAINRKTGIKERMVGALTTYAMIYSDKKMYDSSLLYLKDALTLAEEMQSPYLQNILIGNLAECYLKKGDLASAAQLYQQTQTLSAKLGDDEGLAIAKSGLGQVYIARGQQGTGLQYLEEAFVMMQQLGIKEQELDVVIRLADNYALAGDYKQAYKYLAIKSELSDSLQKQKSRQEVEQMLFDYELQKKEAEIAILEKDNAIQLQQNRNQKMIIWTALSVLLVVLVASYLIYRNARILKTSKQAILKQKENLEFQTAKLSELNDFKDTTFSLLAHDLRSPVNALAGTMLMLDEKLMTPEEFAGYQHELNNKLQAVSILIDNMLYWAKSQMKGEFTLNIEKLNIKRKIDRALAVLKDAAQQKNIKLIDNVPDTIHAFGDRDHIDIIVRNIVSNAIKFTHDGGSVIIGADTVDAKTTITVSDTGVGMTDKQIKQMFDDDLHVSTKGTEGEKGTGLGLHLCYQLIKQNNGDIQVSSEPGVGSTFTIILPAA